MIMAAPIYRDEFEDRMQNMVGFMKTSIDSARHEINRNTDAKFAAVIKHYDDQLETIMKHYDEQIGTLTKQNDELKQEVTTLKEEGARRERKLDAVLKALNVSMEDI
jgi:hypothetical protein